MDGITRDDYRQQHTERAWDRAGDRVFCQTRLDDRTETETGNNQFLASVLLEKTSREKPSQPIFPGEKLKKGNHEKITALSPILCSNARIDSSSQQGDHQSSP